MRITDLEVDGYGVWSGLKLEGLSDGLNVLYGPNEAGKTTLLQFVRGVLYGFSQRRRHYFPPLRGGRPGGSIHVADPSGRFCLDRHAEGNGKTGDAEQFILTAADGTRQGEHLVKVLLCHVDEAIYNNVFAVGLREMQELGALSDTEAAELLFSLTAGLDRVSLVDVMRELEISRNRILDRRGESCQIVQLLEQRETLRQEIEELGKLTRRYEHLAAGRNQLEREVARLEEEDHQAEYRARVIELAIVLRDRWAQRAELDDQLAALGPSAALAEGAVERLDAINARLQKHQQRAEQLQAERDQLRSEAAGLNVNEALWRQSARIEALQEQESWLATLQNHVGELETEIGELQSEVNTEHQRLGLGDQVDPGSLPTVSARTLSMLRPPAKAIRQGHQRLDEARQQLAASGETVRSLAAEIETTLSAHGGGDLTKALDTAGNRVSQLRRRLQIDDRLDEMTRYQRDLEEQSRHLVDRQLLPVWILVGLGTVFVFGVVLVMAGLFMPASIIGSVGWAMALLGLAGSGAAGLGKFLLERSRARQLETCQKQISMLQMQIQQAKEERDELDRRLRGGGGPIASRLETAQRELAALEELVPLDTRREGAQQEIHAATGRVNLAKDRLVAGRRRWREALAAAGLPLKLTPKQVRQLAQRNDQLSTLQRRLGHRREELQQRRRELDALLGRIAQLITDTAMIVSGEHPAEHLRQLVEATARQESVLQRRHALRQQSRMLRRKGAKHEEAVSRLKHGRRELLRDSDAKDEQAFRQRAVRAARADVLREQREALGREITAAIGGQCPEAAVREQLESDARENLEGLRDQLLERLGSLEQELQGQFEKRGQLAEQLKGLAENRELALKQLELATVESRLEEAIRRWQVLAVTTRTLETIRTTYEQERQPETLQEASGYLNRLTQGRYRRVWTPLGEDVLRLDDADGNSLAAELLSRGTREQLFLALRLALVSSYARRGASLPLVLDDVLVNFDADRAKAAAAVLRDFAAAGHQLLIFTCHEHILKLFKSLKVPVSRLPDNAQSESASITFETAVKQAPKRRKKADRSPPEIVEEPEEEDISADDEIALSEAEEEEVFESSEEKEEEFDDDEREEDEEFDDDEYEEEDDAAEAA